MAKDRIRLIGDWPTWGPEAKHAYLSRGGEEVQVLVVPVEAESASALGTHQDDARRMTRAADPGVLRLLLATDMGGRTVRVYESFAGCSLAHLQDGSLPVRVVVDAGAAVARALAAVQGGAPGEPEMVVHPGPRPRDVLVDARGEVKVAGFRRVVDGAEPGWASPDGYQPPEGARGELRGSYGLGALLVTLLSGERPAGAGTSPAEHADVVRRALLGVMARPGSPVPDGLVQLLRRCLAATPQERPSLSDVASELDTIGRRVGGPDLRMWSSARIGAELQNAGLQDGPPARRGGREATPAGAVSHRPPPPGRSAAIDDAPHASEDTVEVARPGMIPAEADPTESVEHPEPTETAAMPLRPPDAGADPARDETAEVDRASMQLPGDLAALPSQVIGTNDIGSRDREPGLGALAGVAGSRAAGPAIGDLRSVPRSAAASSAPVRVGEDVVAGRTARRVGLGIGAVVFMALASWALAPGGEHPSGSSPAGGPPAQGTMEPPPVADVSTPATPSAGTELATPPPPPAERSAPGRVPSVARSSGQTGPSPSAKAAAPRPERNDGSPIRIRPPQADPAPNPGPPATPAPAPGSDLASDSRPGRRGETNSASRTPGTGFRVEFHSEDPTVTTLEVRCRRGRGDGAASVVLPDAGEGDCKVTGRRDGLSLVATVRLTGPAIFRCFEDGSRSCR